MSAKGAVESEAGGSPEMEGDLCARENCRKEKVGIKEMKVKIMGCMDKVGFELGHWRRHGSGDGLCASRN